MSCDLYAFVKIWNKLTGKAVFLKLKKEVSKRNSNSFYKTYRTFYCGSGGGFKKEQLCIINIPKLPFLPYSFHIKKIVEKTTDFRKYVQIV